MKIKIITIDPELSTRTKRVLASIAIPAVLLGGVAIAYASVPKTWAPNDTLTADDLNGNFSSLDGRVTTLEGKTPAVITSESSTIEHGTGTYEDLVYQSVFVNLPPGTWSVTAQATLTTTVSSDAVQISLWDNTAGVELKQVNGASTRSPVASTPLFPVSTNGSCGTTTSCGDVASSTAGVVKVTASPTTRVQIKGYRNGGSELWIGGFSGAGVALPLAARITATQLD